MNCLSCTAETSNGLALCERCQQTLRTSLVNTAAYYTDVDRIQPGQRVKVRSAYQSTPPSTLSPPAWDKVSEALDEAGAIVVGWARNLADDRPQVGKVPTTIPTACGWLESYVGSIATLEWAGECVREMVRVEHMLRRLLDKADTGQFAGYCGNEVGREEVEGETVPLLCPRGLYSGVGKWVTCPECGRAWDADERREVMRVQAEDEVAPVRVLAKIAVGLTDEVSEERLTRRIEKWIERDQLHDLGVRVLDGRPRRVYRIGDVLRLVRGEVKPRESEAC